MIWNPQDSIAPSVPEAVFSISAEINDACSDRFLLDLQGIEELAKAVECALEEQDDLARDDSKQILLLASRALSSLGEEEAARRLAILGSGTVRPSEWHVVGGRDVWVLDLSQLLAGNGTGLELAFFIAINIVLESMADVWDESSGSVVLGLRHVSPAASKLAGNSSGKKAASALAAEIRMACERKLCRMRLVRGWRESPEVLSLDM